MVHYKNSKEYLNQLYELLVNLLLQQEDIKANDNSLHEGIERNSNSGSAEEGD